MNIQNIPRTEKSVKRAFIPKLDAFLFGDYQALEMRLLAFYLATSIDDWSLVEEFNRGLDPHKVTAESLFGKTNVSDEERQKGKTLNFSVIYGGGAATVMRQLKCSREEAIDLLKRFHSSRPGLGQLTRLVQETLIKRGYIKTIAGRRLRPESPHKALNYVIQGTGGELIRDSIIKSHKWLSKEGMVSHIVAAIHDELMLDVLDEEIEDIGTQLPALMSNDRIAEVVPLPVDVEVAYDNWSCKQEWR